MAGCNKVAKCNDRPLDARASALVQITPLPCMRAYIRAHSYAPGGYSRRLEANARACRKEILVNVSSRLAAVIQRRPPSRPAPVARIFFLRYGARYSFANSPKLTCVRG